MTLLFRSGDRKLGVLVNTADVATLLRICADAADLETGGVLVGRYAADGETAVVTTIGKPPDDSRAGRTWFERGVRGVASWLAELWSRRERTYYLGEWHFHPQAAPTASNDDKRQLLSISRNAAYKCPEPVMLIIGGDPRGDWSARAYVTAGGRFLALERIES
jgi:integrative and conjugative element protein (TIGR02256 family)